MDVMVEEPSELLFPILTDSTCGEITQEIANILKFLKSGFSLFEFFRKSCRDSI